MTLERIRVQVGLCPLTGKTRAVSYRTPTKDVSYEDTSEESGADPGSIKVTVPLIKVGRQASDKIVTVALCPLLRTCGGIYEAAPGWEILSSCTAVLRWTWPEKAGCLLKSGSLVGGKSGLLFEEELGPGAGNIIYRVDDDRNPECAGCGMAGADRQTTCDDPVPGETFTLNACIKDQTCILLYGEDGCHGIGTVLFQTVGFMGGVIHDVFDEDARVYEVFVNGELTGAVGTDLTKYDIGDWVALAKVGTEFPLDEFDELETVTDSNVPTVGVEDYVILPYQFAGVA